MSTEYVGRETLNKPLALALGVAEMSRCVKKHGALLIRKGSVIGAANNVKRHCPDGNSWRDSYIHAEQAVLRSVPKGSGLRVYTVYC